MEALSHRPHASEIEKRDPTVSGSRERGDQRALGCQAARELCRGRGLGRATWGGERGNGKTWASARPRPGLVAFSFFFYFLFFSQTFSKAFSK